MDMLNKIINWAQREDAIRAVILTGSRAKEKHVDEFADFDITLFVPDPIPYIDDDLWIHNLGKVWAYIPDKICASGQKDYYTYTVIFESKIKVDFAFFTINILSEIEYQKDLVTRFANAYKVLLDKDKLVPDLSSIKNQISESPKPSQLEFINLINEFFIEVYLIAKYLQRGELWHVKFHDWAIKDFLLRMIEWHEKAIHGWNYNTYYLGVHMSSWVNRKTWDSLKICFAHFDAEDSQKALKATINLFREISQETATKLDYFYPIEVDKNISEFINTLHKKSN